MENKIKKKKLGRRKRGENTMQLCYNKNTLCK